MLENKQYDKKSLRFLKSKNTDWMKRQMIIEYCYIN